MVRILVVFYIVSTAPLTTGVSKAFHGLFSSKTTTDAGLMKPMCHYSPYDQEIASMAELSLLTIECSSCFKRIS